VSRKFAYRAVPAALAPTTIGQTWTL
jgi:hypothetical protein